MRPTRRQEATLAACLEDTRQLYDAALEERREAWRMGHHQVTFYGQDAQLNNIRAEDPERYGRWSFSCERAAIRRLDRAFQGFYRRVKAGEKPGYPRFKGRGWWDSIEWPEGNGPRWDSVPHPKVTRVYFVGVGHVRVHQHRAVKGRIKTITARVARLHGTVARQRLDHAHQTALALVRAHDVIAHENLEIANMTARAKPRPAAAPCASGGVTTTSGRDAGVKFAIDIDAHAIGDLGNLPYGVGTAQRGWLTADDVINTWPLERLREFLRKGRAS